MIQAVQGYQPKFALQQNSNSTQAVKLNPANDQFVRQSATQEVKFGNSTGGSGNKLKAAGALGLLGLLGVGLGYPMARGVSNIFHEEVAPGVTCVLTRDSDIKEVLESGRHSVNPIKDELTCFETAPHRVTDGMELLSSDRIQVKVNVSVAWQPNVEEMERVLTEVYGTGNNTALKEYFPEVDSQISQQENKVLYENAIFSELRSMLEEFVGLVPARAIGTSMFNDALHDAFMNGYSPKEVRDTFASLEFDNNGNIVNENDSEGAINEDLLVPIQDEWQSSLQDRITARYAKTEIVDGESLEEATPLILITDADTRNNEIVNQRYKDALEDLALQDIVRDQARERQITAEITADADEQEALEQRRVRLAEEETDRQAALIDAQREAEVATIDAQTAAEILQIEAESEAEAIRLVGEALASNPSYIDQLYAEGFKEAARNDNLIITGAGAGGQQIQIEVPAPGN